MMKERASLPGPAFWILIATSFAFVVVQLDVTIVNVALPQIGSSLKTGITGLQWVVDAYTLSFAVFLISAGVLGDLLGSRRGYLWGFLLFTGASLACGLASTAGLLVAARALQGMGAALLIPNSLSLLNHAARNDDGLRARMVGLWTAAGGVSIAAGPIAGGLLVGALGWRSIFLVNVPLGILGALLTLRFVPGDKTEPAAEKRAFDLLGQLLAIAALTGLTGAVIEVGHLGLKHPLVIAGFALAMVAGYVFAIVEAKAPSPMLPLYFFRLPSFTAAVLFGVLVNLTYYGVVFVLTLYLQRAHGYSALRAGLAYLPLTATFIASNVVSARVAARAGPRFPMVVGSLIGGTGFALLLRLGPATSFLTMLPAFTLIPLGMGLAVPAMTTVILSAVDGQRAGTASALLNTARQAGGAMGVAVFGVLAGSTSPQVISGLHKSALISVILLLVAAAMAFIGIRSQDRCRKSPSQELEVAKS